MKGAAVLLVLIALSAGLAGCVEAFEGAAEALAEAANEQCQGAEAEAGGRVFMGMPRGAELPVRGPGVLTIAASLETSPLATAVLELRGPDGDRVWGIEAGFGSGGAEGETAFTNPPPGTYTIHVEGAPFADYGYFAVVVSCGGA